MDAQQINREEIAAKGRAIYESTIRFALETEENIGKMVAIDVDSGAYELDDEKSSAASNHLRALNPSARIFGIRIGYRAAYALGGVMQRIQRCYLNAV